MTICPSCNLPIKRNQSSVKTFEDPVKHLSCLKKELKCKRKKWLYLAGGRHRNDDSDSEVRITDRMCCLSSAGHNPVRFSIGEARLPTKPLDNTGRGDSPHVFQGNPWAVSNVKLKTGRELTWNTWLVKVEVIRRSPPPNYTGQDGVRHLSLLPWKEGDKSRRGWRNVSSPRRRRAVAFRREWWW